MAQIDDLSAAVAAESTMDDSIIKMLNGLVDQLKAAQTAPAASGAQAASNPALDEVIANIQANTKRLSDAVVANTPVVVVPAGSTTVPDGTPVTTAPASGATQDGVTPAVSQ